MVRLAAIVRGGAEPGRQPPGPMTEPGATLCERLAALLGPVPTLIGGRAFPWAPLEALVDEVLDGFERTSAALWEAMARPAAPGVDPLADHHVRTAVLALRLGRALGYAPAELRALGVAACVFDVGRAAGSGPALDRDHPRRSAAIVAAWQPPAPTVATVALQHHERAAGQGYPAGLRGDAIHPHAAVVGLADEYTRRIATESPHGVVRAIVRDRAFPAPVVRAFLQAVSVFPPGSLVRLNTGERGRVVDVNPSHPLRPVVELLTDARGAPLAAPRRVNLLDAPFRCVSRPDDDRPTRPAAGP